MEDYKKLYEQTQRRMKEFIKRWDGIKLSSNDLFTEELKQIVEIENEDEMVRKEIIETFKILGDGKIPVDINYADIFTWLEKQGKKETLCDKCRKEHPSHSCQDITALGRCAVEHKQKPADKVESMKHSYITTNSEFFQWIYDRLKYVYNENPNVDYMLSLKERIEDMRKPTYMVKPKFHKGDFIKHNRANIICKVISVNSGSYYVENIETNGRIELFNVEQNFHLWSIEDAKEGDVLHSPEHNLLWIYKNKEESHAGVNLNYANSISVGSDIVIPSDVCPATKEQRDILFAKMREEGYEWNADEKELKKIEDESKDCKQQIMSEITDLVTDYITQKPTGWTEEDEAMYTRTLGILGKCYMGMLPTKVEEELNWFKSLRPQKQWKPSNVQMQALKEACDKHWEPDGLDTLYTLYEQLKKLTE